MAAAQMNIQAQLDRLKASLNSGTPRVQPAQPAFDSYGAAAQVTQPQAVAVSPDAGGMLKKYGKFVILGVAVLVIVGLFLKRKKALACAKKTPARAPPQPPQGFPPASGFPQFGGPPAPQQQQQQQQQPHQQQQHQQQQPNFAPPQPSRQPVDPNFTPL